MDSLSSKVPPETKNRAIAQIKEGLTDTEISNNLHISTNTLRRWRKSERLPNSPGAGKRRKIPPEVKAESIELMKEGLTDTEISNILPVSTRTLRNWRKSVGLAASSGGRKAYTNDQLNDVIDLIRELAPIGEIVKLTGVNRTRIHKLHKEEIANGNILPDLVKGVARRTKYTDEELVDLASLNPGYGLKRFVNLLRVTERYVIDLFLDLKEFTEGEIDLLVHLQDERFGEMVTRKEYVEITGEKHSPRGSGLSTSRASGGSKGNNAKSIYLPPQEFNWGEHSKNSWRSSAADKHLEWINERIAEKGYISSREDKEDFCSSTGAGLTKFNKWMSKAGLVFDKKENRWYPGD